MNSNNNIEDLHNKSHRGLRNYDVNNINNTNNEDFSRTFDTNNNINDNDYYYSNSRVNSINNFNTGAGARFENRIDSYPSQDINRNSDYKINYNNNQDYQYIGSSGILN
jgi:hypothetical protein